MKALHSGGKTKRVRRFGFRFYLVLVLLLEFIASVFPAVGIHILLRRCGASVWTELAVLLVFGAVISAVFSIYLLSMTLKPTKRLNEAIEQISLGNYDVQLDSGCCIRDLIHLDESFNMMAKDLAATELLQSDFVASVSHEIKTPVAAIKGFAELLRDGNLEEEERDEVLRRIIANTDRLSSLVGSVLLISRIENGHQRKVSVTYRLDEQIRQAFLTFDSEWENKELDFDIELDDIEYTGDEPIMMHVWLNLISNAIKFTPRGGHIGMYLRAEGQSIRFIIEDSGPGFAPGTEKHIFEKFYQGDSSHKSEGNGLGLALVKNILDRNGGTIIPENIPGGGARMTVILSTADRQGKN